MKILSLLLSFLYCLSFQASDNAAAKRLERLKKRMSAKADPAQKPEEKKPESKPDEKKAEEKKPDEAKPDEAKKPEEKTPDAKPDEKKTDEKKDEKEKKSEEKKPEEKPEDKKSEDKKSDEKKPEEKKPDEAKPSPSSSIGEGGKVDLGKAVADEGSTVDRNWEESMAERDKLEQEGVQLLKKAQEASEKGNELSAKIDKVHEETRALINQTYKDYAEPMGTYEQMGKEISKYLSTSASETDAKIKDNVKDLEKYAKTLEEAVTKIKKAIEEVDKLEKDNEETFAKSQEKSVVIIKKLGEMQVAYNDIPRAKAIADAQTLIKTIQSALDECLSTNKDLESQHDKISTLSKDLPDKVKAAKDAYQDTQNTSEKVTEIMNSIEKIRLESSDKKESKVVKTLKKMSNFVSKKKEQAQAKPTTFGMAIFNFFANVANGVKDFFVRLFVIQTSPATAQEPTKASSEAETDKKASEKPKSEESKPADKKEESKEDKKPDDKKPDEKKDEKPKADAKKEDSKDAQAEEKSESKEPDLQVKQEEIKSALTKVTDSIKLLASSVVGYVQSLYSTFANKKKV